MDSLDYSLPSGDGHCSGAGINPWRSAPQLTSSMGGTVRAHSAHAPAGRGPESPVAKFLIGGLVTVLFEMSGEAPPTAAIPGIPIADDY